MADYTAWYRVGTAALTKDSKIVTGTGTFWLAAGLHTGDMFSTDCVTEYEIASVDSNTQITLRTPYTGDTTTETAYRIVRNFTASMAAETAANTAALLNDFRRFADLQMQSIHGKSAYQIACDKGYVGTESEWAASLKGDNAYQVAVANGYTGTVEEWLESLKAAGEWETLDARTEILAYKEPNRGAADIHNAFNRGKNLGAFTAEHSAAIRANTFDDIYPGDYFRQPVPAYEWTDHEGTVHQEAARTIDVQVLGCNSFEWMLRYANTGDFQPHVAAWAIAPIQAPMNSNRSTAGGYVGSEVFTQVLLKAEALLKAAFGEEHVLPHKDLLCNSVTNGKETGWAWYTDRICDLLSEVMVTGKNIYSEPIKLLDSGDGPYIGQQPFFANRITPRHIGLYAWLRDAADDVRFTTINPAGGVTNYPCWASGNWGNVFPFFLLY